MPHLTDLSVTSEFGDRGAANLIISACVAPFLALSMITLAATEAAQVAVSWLLGRVACTQPRIGLSGEQPVQIFDPDRLKPADWARLRRDFVDRGVPFVLRLASGAPLTTAAPPQAAVADAFASQRIRVASTRWFDAAPGLDQLVARIFGRSRWSPLAGRRAYFPLWFLGTYSQGQAHVDLGVSSINCYYLARGGKDVAIVPPELTRGVKLGRRARWARAQGLRGGGARLDGGRAVRACPRTAVCCYRVTLCVPARAPRHAGASSMSAAGTTTGSTWRRSLCSSSTTPTASISSRTSPASTAALPRRSRSGSSTRRRRRCPSRACGATACTARAFGGASLRPSPSTYSEACARIATPSTCRFSRARLDSGGSVRAWLVTANTPDTDRR